MYGGYFGAGSGVMMLAVLGLGADLPFQVTNALKTLAVLAANLVASLIFVFAADIDWRAAILLASGSVVGGYVGADRSPAAGRAAAGRGSSLPGSWALSCSGA